MDTSGLEIYYLVSLAVINGFCLAILHYLTKYSPDDPRTAALKWFCITLVAWAYMHPVLVIITRILGPETGFTAYRFLISLALLPQAVGSILIYTLLSRITLTKKKVILTSFLLLCALQILFPGWVSTSGKTNINGFPLTIGPAVLAQYVYTLAVIGWPLLLLTKTVLAEKNPQVKKEVSILAGGAWLSLLVGLFGQYIVVSINPDGPMIGNASMIFIAAAAFYVLYRYERVLTPRELYRTTVRVIPNGLAHIRDHRITWASPGLAKMLGYDRPENLTGLKPVDLEIPAGTKSKPGIWSDLNKCASLIEGRSQLKTVDGQALECMIALTPLDETAPARGLLAVFTDVTSLTMARDELSRSEARYRSLVENAMEVIVVIRNQTILFVSPGSGGLTGWTPEQVAGRKIDTFFNDDTMAEIGRRGKMILAGEKPAGPLEALINTKAGNQKWVEMSAGKIDWEGGPALQVVIRDVTDRKLAEEEKLKSERLNGALEMAGAAAHELNQPLTVVSGQVELAAMKMNKDNVAMHHLTEAQTAIDRLAELTDRIGRIVRRRTKDYLTGETIIDIKESSD